MDVCAYGKRRPKRLPKVIHGCRAGFKGNYIESTTPIYLQAGPYRGTWKYHGKWIKLDRYFRPIEGTPEIIDIPPSIIDWWSVAQTPTCDVCEKKIDLSFLLYEERILGYNKVCNYTHQERCIKTVTCPHCNTEYEWIEGKYPDQYGQGAVRAHYSIIKLPLIKTDNSTITKQEGNDMHTNGSTISNGKLNHYVQATFDDLKRVPGDHSSTIPIEEPFNPTVSDYVPYSSSAEVIEELISRMGNNYLSAHDGSRITQILIDPVLAQGILDHLNSKNPRKQKEDLSAKYGADMTPGTGVWYTSYSPLIFEGPTFDEVDGQHRLRAVVMSNTEQLFVCVFYAAPDAKKGVDQGGRRPINITHNISNDQGACANVIRQLTYNDFSRQTLRSEKVKTYSEYSKSMDPVIEAALRGVQSSKTRRASFITAFTIALHHTPDYKKNQVLELLEDVIYMKHKYPMSLAITTLLINHKSPNGDRYRCDQTLQILRGISRHLEGETIHERTFHQLKPTTSGLRYFIPDSQYRENTPSNSLATVANRKKNKA